MADGSLPLMSMSSSSLPAHSALLRAHNLRDTRPRRAVLRALMRLGRAVSIAQIHAALERTDGGVNTVTVYRILEAFARAGIVHREPETGRFFLCQLPGEAGHHVFLQCLRCGRTEERQDARLCQAEDALAKRAGFLPQSHITQIRGTCRQCRKR